MDLIEVLRAYDNNGTAQWKDPARAADEIERLRADNQAQARQSGNLLEEVAQLRTQLAESQAREMVLHDGVEAAYQMVCAGVLDEENSAAVEIAYMEDLKHATADDHSALDALLTQARAKERDTVIEYIRNNYQDHNIASLCDAIKELK